MMNKNMLYHVRIMRKEFPAERAFITFFTHNYLYIHITYKFVHFSYSLYLVEGHEEAVAFGAGFQK